MSDEAQAGQPPQGWYPDPNDPSRLRWWDGNAWTEHTHAGQQGGQAAGQEATASQQEQQQQAAAASQAGAGAVTGGQQAAASSAAPGPAATQATQGAQPGQQAGTPKGEKSAIAQWLSVRSNQALLAVLIIAVLLFAYVMLIYPE